MVGQPGFFDLEDRLAGLSKTGDPLERLARVVDFEIVNAARNFPRSVECTPEAGQFQAAVSTRWRACFSS